MIFFILFRLKIILAKIKNIFQPGNFYRRINIIGLKFGIINRQILSI